MIVLNTIQVPVQFSVTSFSFKVQFLGYSIDSCRHDTKNYDLACSYSLNLPSVSKNFLLPTSLLLANMPLWKQCQILLSCCDLGTLQKLFKQIMSLLSFPQLGSYLNYTRFNVVSSVISPPHIRSLLQKTSECFILWKI